MALTLSNLDERTRGFMLKELEEDNAAGKLYISSRLTASGKKDYPTILREAIQNGTDTSLASKLDVPGMLVSTESKTSSKGRGFTSAVPKNAAETLAEGEFNRFYSRGLSRRAIEDKIPNLVIYRAKEVAVSRPDSEAKIGTLVPAQKLLEDLRTSNGVDPALGLPSGPNSGLSVELP